MEKDRQFQRRPLGLSTGEGTKVMALPVAECSHCDYALRDWRDDPRWVMG